MANTKDIVNKLMTDIETVNKDSKNVVDVDIRLLRAFGGVNRKHAFKINGKKIDELTHSIEQYGVLTPLLIRKDPEEMIEGGYEILAGHHRWLAATNAGLKTVPCIVMEVEDDTSANQIMATSNRQREHLTISERAFIYKYEYEMLRKQGKRSDISKEQNKDAIDILSESYGESGTTLRRYFRITLLIDELIDMVDSNKLQIYVAANLSYLTETEQMRLYSLLENEKYKITDIIAIALKDASKSIKNSDASKELGTNEIKNIITANTYEEETEKVIKCNLKLPANLGSYFPKKIDTKEKREQVILTLIEAHKDEIAKIAEAL